MLDPILNEVKTKVTSSWEVFLSDLNSIHTGIASPSLLDGVVVDVHGAKMKLNQLASISVINSKMLGVNVWDRNNVGFVKDAIMYSDLGLNPVIEGVSMRLPLPDLTQERRKDLVKVLKKYADRAKVALRNIRRDSIAKIKLLEKNKEVSEDEMHAQIKKIDKIINDEDNKIDLATEKKEQDILKV